MIESVTEASGTTVEIIPRVDGIWTGDLNEHALAGAAQPPRVRFYDTTLRDGEQTVGVVLAPEQKLVIAQALDELGIERIEAGFPRVSDDDWRAVELIRDAGLRAEVWGFSRAVPADVDAIVELGLKATVIESPLSDLKLDALGVSREKMIGRITDAVSYAAGKGILVAFFGVDGSRADLRFLEEAYRAAIEAGAREAVAVDTLGIASPEAAAFLVSSMRRWLGPDVPVHWHGHNDFGLATAAAIAAARAGAEWIQGTINGMGERAGNASLGEVAMALRALYGVETALDLGKIREVSALVRDLGGYELEPWKSVVGENLFIRESGAVAAQFHDPPSIEPFSSTLVGAERRIVLGKKSGLDSIRIKAEELGIDVPEDQRAALLDAVKRLGTEKRGLVTDDEFRELARTVAE
jgi:isopropylmalate/homocitrate/citramalate synthase